MDTPEAFLPALTQTPAPAKANRTLLPP